MRKLATLARLQSHDYEESIKHALVLSDDDLPTNANTLPSTTTGSDTSVTANASDDDELAAMRRKKRKKRKKSSKSKSKSKSKTKTNKQRTPKGSQKGTHKHQPQEEVSQSPSATPSPSKSPETTTQELATAGNNSKSKKVHKLAAASMIVERDDTSVRALEEMSLEGESSHHPLLGK